MIGATMFKYTLFIGHNVGNVEMLTSDGIIAACMLVFDTECITHVSCEGCWRNMRESSSQVIIYSETPITNVHGRVRALSRMYRQESIMFDETSAVAGLVFA